jgi:hypothetical protein
MQLERLEQLGQHRVQEFKRVYAVKRLEAELKFHLPILI